MKNLTFDKETQSVLSLIYKFGIIKGSEIQRKLTVDDVKLKTILRMLEIHGFIVMEIGHGSPLDSEIFLSFISPLVSKKNIGEYEINKSTY